MKELSWKPVRRGLTYCSPACGGGCTKAEFDATHKRGLALAKRMGRGWTVHVWENLGWHMRVDSPGGSGAVYDHGGGGSYWADFHFAEKQFHATARTPELAVKLALGEARKVSVLLARELRELP